MKSSLRSIGVDDGYFPISYKGSKKKTLLAAVYCINNEIYDFVLEPITVDGLDGTKAAVKAVERLGRADVIFQDGVTVAGFNIIDPEELSRLVGMPVVVFFKHDLNLNKVLNALKKHFNDWQRRYDVIDKVYSKSVVVPTPWRYIRISAINIDVSEALNYIIKLQAISPIPEPLRLADIIASGLTRNAVLLEVINEQFGFSI